MAEVDPQPRLAGHDVRRPHPGGQLEDLHRARREKGVAFVPARRHQLGEGGREAVRRIVRALGVGDVALDALDRDPPGERASPPRLVGVAQHRLARRLDDQRAVEPHTATQKFVQRTGGAVVGWALLVARQEQGGGSRRPFQSDDRRRHGRLHVARAPPDQEGVALHRLERVARPALARKDHVDMTVEGEPRSRAARRPEVARVGVFEDLHGEAGLFQAGREQVEDPGVVGGDAGECDEPFEKGECFHRGALRPVGARVSQAWAWPEPLQKAAVL